MLDPVILAYSFCFLSAGCLWVCRLRIYAWGATTRGVVVDYEEHVDDTFFRNRKNRYAPIVVYHDASGETHRFSPRPSRIWPLAAGEKVPVRYLPSNPKWVHFVSWELWIVPAVLAACGAFIAWCRHIYWPSL